jgi:uncharacterized protein (DUF305 family)
VTRRQQLTAGVIAAIVVLAGCSSSEPQPRAQAQPPVPDEVDVGFARDMATHHAQAVDMADRIRVRTDDPELRILATDIVLTQQAQIGRMQGWLDVWDEPLTTTDAPMSWADDAVGPMDHGADGSGGAMPGMADPAAIAELDALAPAEAELRFLELMIAHHRGGVQMAEAAVALDPSEVVGDLARSIIDGQTAEIETMDRMLAQRTAAQAGS